MEKFIIACIVVLFVVIILLFTLLVMSVKTWAKIINNSTSQSFNAVYQMVDRFYKKNGEDNANRKVIR